jgi:hypothetical protein
MAPCLSSGRLPSPANASELRDVKFNGSRRIRHHARLPTAPTAPGTPSEATLPRIWQGRAGGDANDDVQGRHRAVNLPGAGVRNGRWGRGISPLRGGFGDPSEVATGIGDPCGVRSYFGGLELREFEPTDQLVALSGRHERGSIGSNLYLPAWQDTIVRSGIQCG